MWCRTVSHSNFVNLPEVLLYYREVGVFSFESYVGSQLGLIFLLQTRFSRPRARFVASVFKECLGLFVVCLMESMGLVSTLVRQRFEPLSPEQRDQAEHGLARVLSCPLPHDVEKNPDEPAPAVIRAELEGGNPLKSVCLVVSNPLTVKCFLLDHLAALGRLCRLTCIANWDEPSGLLQCGVDVPLVHVPIERTISPGRDLRALWTLQAYFRKSRVDVVHSVTPKAGLLAMTAAAIAGVPVRIHTFTGQVWPTALACSELS